MRSRQHLPLVLVIIDGWGTAPPGPGNAITRAKTPVMHALTRQFPSTKLDASGAAVGLPANQEGNSEAGHMNIGAGRIVEQDSVRISRSISEGRFFKNAAFRAAFHHVNKYRSQLHLMGLLTKNQSGHADPDHLLALLTLANSSKMKRVVLHLFTDGRDSPPNEGVALLQRLEKMLRRNETIGTVMGRYYSMDRKKQWLNTERAYHAMVLGEGRRAGTAEQAVIEAYERGETDEYVSPTVVGERKKHRIGTNDAVIFFNLRSDRARQLTKAFVQKKFNERNPGSFRRKRIPRNLLFVAMTDFGPDLGDVYTAFPSVDLYNTLPVALREYRQLYAAETEKYAHVTFFFNGGYDRPVAGEDRLLVPSPNVMSYDTVPEMSAPELTRRIIMDLRQHHHDVYTVNFANPDMVGHTGNLQATVRAVEVVDACIGKIWTALRPVSGTLVVTADHGNAEAKLAVDGKSVKTEHTIDPVPFLIAQSKIRRHFVLRKSGKLADVAPTILDLLSVTKPKDMTGRSLLRRTHVVRT